MRPVHAASRRRLDGALDPTTCTMWLRVCLVVFMMMVITPSGSAATFTVTTTEDSGDASLRGAINQANAAAGPDTVVFALSGAGPHTISVQYALPYITETVLIDGYTQPGASPATELEQAIIMIDVRGLNSSSSGITLMGDGSTVRGVAISGFSHGIRLRGDGGHTLHGNFIGTDATGTVPLGNVIGLTIEAGGNIVGGTAPGASNIISGNTQHGIQISTGEWQEEPGPQNAILGNSIGTDATGLVNLGNGACGIEVFFGADNAIGDGTPEGANSIAYNGTVGVFVEHGVRNAIVGNSIFSNGGLGIDLMWDYWDSSPDGPTPNDLGDGDWGANDLQNYPIIASVTEAGGSTTIEGSLNSIPLTTYRIEFYFNSAPDASDYGEGETLAGFADVTTDGNGDVSFSVTVPVAITEGTFVAATATDPLNNTSEFSRCIVYGGSTVVTNTEDTGPGSFRNAIATANLSPGHDTVSFALPGAGPHTIRPLSPLPFITEPVEIDGYSQPGAVPATETSDAVILIEIDGSMEVGDYTHGLMILADSTTVKGLAVNRFTGFGIGIDGHNGNIIAGNRVGTDAEGVNGLGNFGGIGIGLGSGNTIGGTAAAERNIVSANTEIGVYVFDSGNIVSGNYIGTDACGLAALGNGVGVLLGSGSMLGGISTEEGNVVSASLSHGVQITGAQNTVRNNLIGLDVSGDSSLGNGGTGVYVGTQASANLSRWEEYIEGSVFSKLREENEDGFPGPEAAPELTQNAIIFNSIYGSGNLAIDLDPPGVNSNDLNDSDGGANNGQNYPVLTSIWYLDETTVVNGQLNSMPNASFHIEFFSSPNPDPTNHGEGWRYLGYDFIETDAYGNAYTYLSYPDSLPAGSFISCTATDENDNTSEFSSNLVWEGSTLVTNTNDDGAGSLRWAIYGANAAPETQIISFNIQGTGPFTIQPTTPLPAIIMPTHVDGFSQPGASEATESEPAVILVNIDGTMAGEGSSGLRIAAGQSTVRGLAITGFAGNGLELYENGDNTISGTFIGLDPSGADGEGNAGNGLLISGCGDNTVGGTSPAERNVISNNGDDGIDISGENAGGNVILGNYIGTDETGAVDFGNEGKGISLTTADNTIGGTSSGHGNVISGNSSDGVYLIGSESTRNTIQGNMIGTDLTGTEALGNDGNGVLIRSPSNTVGGAWIGAGNVISANGEAGIGLAFSYATENRIYGNIVGSDPSGELDLGNGASGIHIRGASNNHVGGDDDDGNRIAYNMGCGVEIAQGGSGNRVLSNEIWGNGLLGIDLEGNGVTPNDAGDTDSGANGRQNYPVVETAAYDTVGILRVDGCLNSAANSSYTIQLFRNSSADSSGYGEGEVLLGQTEVTTDANGEASWDLAFLAEDIPGGSSVSATATDAGGSTSEFSLSLAISGLSVDEEVVPELYSLVSGFPNPFRNQTTFLLGLAGGTHVSVKIYNMLGELTRTLVDRRLDAGNHALIWDGRDDNKRRLAAGVYFYKAVAGPLRRSGKLVMVK